jgi:hypothetical protein
MTKKNEEAHRAQEVSRFEEESMTKKNEVQQVRDAYEEAYRRFILVADQIVEEEAHRAQEMSEVATTARRAEWRVHNLQADYMLALEESGGEFTAEVEEIETRLAKNADELALAGVSLRAHAKAMAEVCKAEKQRLGELSTYWAKLEGVAVRWIRIAAAEKGDRFEAGTFRVSLQKPRASVVAVNEGPTPDEQRCLVESGLAVFEFRASKSAIGAELKKGAEVPGYMLEYPAEKVVVVK